MSHRAEHKSVATSAEVPDRRRSARRRHFEEHGVLSTCVRPGHRAKLIDVSADGALIETSHRLLPGMKVELHLETHTRRASIRGRVLRCAITRVRSSLVCYRGAIGFERHLGWFADEDGYPLPGHERRPGRPGRVDITPQVV